MAWLWLLAFLICFSTLAYQSASLSVWTIAVGTFLILLTLISPFSFLSLLLAWLVFFIVMIPLFMTHLRRQLIIKKILNFYRKNRPVMSTTEREALAAGTVGWEGELFRGKPNWNKLLNYPRPTLSAEEKAFLNGPVETLCRMIDDWEITQRLADLPAELWQYLKDEGFFALIIPKAYGGKAFSAYAHSQILTKVYGRSTTVATTIAVPNSLGPAELLLHYGTPEQKNYYLPRLARGDEMPCFALTGPEAGSDAGAMTDRGVVCWGQYQNQKMLGIRLNWNKRYITLAPVATVIGLAFKLEDPDHLLGKKVHLGITCALIPRDTDGVTIGRRHFPCNIVFQNGPTQGKDVFIPLDWIIGGPAMVGQGWRMLMECLASGRAISLPASGIGGAKVCAYTAGAYARIRKQFNTPIGRFEGIEAVIGRMMGYTYIMDATRTFTAGIIDLGEKPAVASAITKYHVTELSRYVGNDAMDLHGGKGICLGPKNYIARAYQSIPIAITVEGANILTRNMIIFGQGAMRCHPYVFSEMEAASEKDEDKSLANFDKAFLGHLSFVLGNLIRTFVLGLFDATIAHSPTTTNKRFFQQSSRFSAAFALLADVSMLMLGSSLKRKENISARLGDILSYLYLLSAVLKNYKDQEEPLDDLPLVTWAGQYCLYQIQLAIDQLLKNYPNRFLSFLLRVIIFPWGKQFHMPSDHLNHEVTQLFLEPTPTRSRLSEGAFIANVPENMLAKVEDALIKVIAAESVEKKLKKASMPGSTSLAQAKLALDQKIISSKEFDIIRLAEEARSLVIAVDDFSPEELI